MRQKIFKYLRPYRVPFSIALLQVFLISAFEILKPWPMKIVIDHVLTGKPVSWAPVSSFSQDSVLLLSCAGLVLIYLFLGGMTIVNNYTTIRIGQHMVNDFRKDLYSHLQRLSLAFHSRRQVGDLLYRVTADTYAIQSSHHERRFPHRHRRRPARRDVLRHDPDRLAAHTTVPRRLPGALLTISLLSSNISLRRPWPGSRRVKSTPSCRRAMSAIRIVQAFTKEEEEHRKFMRASTSAWTPACNSTLQTFYSGIINVVMALGTACVVWIGAKHVLQGSLSVGDIVVFTSYLASLYAPINTISQTWGVIQRPRWACSACLKSWTWKGT